jgi:hypothetical protein
VAKIEAMATRLFPKNQGAAGYAISGIAARCDWVVLSDAQPPRVALVNRAGITTPRHVFLSLRAPFDALAFFHDEVLPSIGSPFVLISGSEDVTIPRQLDRRWRSFTIAEVRRIEALLEDRRIIHWYAENLDECHRKLSPLPTGMVFPDPATSHEVTVPCVPPLGTRPLKILCAHRVREGPQWDVRRKVTHLCRELRRDICTVIENEVTEDVFVKLLQEHSFVICAEGGGLDPSPKAWQAVLHGAIPILRSTPLDEAYARLPVAIVERWDASVFDVAELERWHRRHAPSHDVPRNRALVVQRLGIETWWELICSHLKPAAG